VITKLAIENLRGIRKGELDGLSQVSVLVGPNNSGKSTCLEAIEIVGTGADLGRLDACISRRGTPKGWEHRLAHTAGAPTALAVEGGPPRVSLINPNPGSEAPFLSRGFAFEAGLNTRFGRLAPGGPRQDPQRTFQVRLVDVGAVRSARALEDAYTTIDNAGRLDAVMRALSAAMPDLADLRIHKVEDDFVLHTVTKSGERVPTYLAGDGFKRLLELAAALADLPNGVALLEEPECYQHPRYLRELVALVQHAAANRTQVIVSTHSLELIDALLHADWPADAAYPSIHRLRLVDGELRSTALTRAQALAARDELAEDLRA
jgi:predicted ATPase